MEEAEQFDIDDEGDGWTCPGLIYVNAHCDQRVLHSPGYCQYCDMYPEAQQKRVELGYDFTNDKPGTREHSCPAIQTRGWDNLNGWGGNQPVGPGVPEDDQVELINMERSSSIIFYGWRPERFEGDDNE